jgi:hypothetical protein
MTRLAGVREVASIAPKLAIVKFLQSWNSYTDLKSTASYELKNSLHVN